MLVTGIGALVTNDPELGDGPLGLRRDAAVVCDGDRVAWVGDQDAVPQAAGDERLDAGGACVIPGFVDAHTHLVFAGDRAEEFAARMEGTPYAAGGIATTVAATRQASTDVLVRATTARAREALRSGTTTMEIKSGYGLTVDHERRLLDVAGGLAGDDVPSVVTTFLGAHVVPVEYSGRSDEYVDLVRGPMLDACAPLAQFCDVFCDEGAFDGAQARAVLTAGMQAGLAPRIHANQLGRGSGAAVAAELGAVSADHLTHLDDRDIEALAGAGVVATLLPAAEFSTRSPWAPARRLLDAGATVALATDCNPGSSYTTSMPFVVATACTQLRMTPIEALRAATAGGAAALGCQDVGRLSLGAQADLVVLAAPSYVHLAYRPGVALVAAVIRAGRHVFGEAHHG